MRKLLIALSLLIGTIVLTYGISSQRNYTHENSTLNDEFDNIYLKFQDHRIPLTQKLFFGGDDNSYISSPLEDNITITVGGTDTLTITPSLITSATDFALSATKKLFFDGGANTYITEVSADRISVYTNGSLAFGFLGNQNVIGGNDIVVSPTKKFRFDLFLGI